MADALIMVNGIPRMRAVSTTGGAVYDETFMVGVGGISAGTPISLPNAGTYNDIDLEIFVGGQFLEPDGVDYNYVGVGPGRTQVTFVNDLFEGDLVRFRVEDSLVTIYDETLNIGVGGITTGTNIALPNGGSYVGDDLEVYLNGEFMDQGIDWNQVGLAPRTAIQMTFDLVEGDDLRFRIDHE